MKLRLVFTTLCIAGAASLALHTWNSDTEAADSKAPAAAPAAAGARNAPSGPASTKEDWQKICHYRAGDNKDFEKRCLENNAGNIGKPLFPGAQKQLDEAKQGKIMERKTPAAARPNANRPAPQKPAAN